MGRLTYDWTVTAKSLISFAAFRQVLSTEDLASVYALNEGISITPSWSPTSKLFFEGQLVYQTFNFAEVASLSESSSSPFLSSRDDDVFVGSLLVGYTLIRNLRFTVAYQNENRDSTQNEAGYDDGTVTATARIDF